MKIIREIGVVLSLLAVSIFISCGDVVLADPVDPDTQLEDDIQVIEDYLAQEGFLDYDTLESEVRAVILEEGDGETIEYEDIIRFHYIGNYIDSLMFDTSVDTLALQQDQAYAIDTTYLKSQVDTELDSLDDEGERIIETIEYEEDYFPIYSGVRNYEAERTAHSPGGWFVQQQSYVGGFKDGVHFALDNVKIRGRALILIPSGQAYGAIGSFPISPNTPIMFEIVPIGKD